MASQKKDKKIIFLRAWQILLPEAPEPEPEYYFAKAIKRMWHFDWAWPPQLVAVEVDGGAFNAGRHSRGVGIANDNDKINTAQTMGWAVLRFTVQQLERDPRYQVALVQSMLEARQTQTVLTQS